MNFYEEIKTSLINNEICKKVKDYSKNKSDLETYYKVGKLLSDAGKHYGEGILKKYSVKLTKEFGKGYTFTALTRMKQFYLLIEKVATMSQQLTYGHYVELMSISDINKVLYYINRCEQLNLSIRQLRELIKSKEYERLSSDTKNKLIKKSSLNIIDLVPNPIIIKNNSNIEIISEKILHNLVLENISDFMEQLGNSYAFIKSEYKIKTGAYYNYIDLLLFNYEYNCFIVVELKVTELKKEHIGQIEVYMNYIDDNLRKPFHDKTIGIIICKKGNKFILKYSSDIRIIATEYELNKKN